jgi:para-aminobenzoate synthetase/4-amino-4-deoxychorismate lyase
MSWANSCSVSCRRRTRAQPPDTPLAQVLLFRGYELLSGEEVTAWLAERAGIGPAGIADMRSNVDEAAFTRAIERIRDYIAAGDTYQVNYTYRIRFDAFGSIYALYARLRERQPVPYGALIGLPDGRAVLSLSPELFVRHDAGRLLARPMKGTAPASGDNDARRGRSSALAADPKNRAENLMIVDLLRNDLGRIARTGSVGVPALFEVRRYSSVLQMTSTVQAQLADGMHAGAIFDALYPCGSITGAPKRRTMEIIHELEPAPRGIYTGALGWMDPPAFGAQFGRCIVWRLLFIGADPHPGAAARTQRRAARRTRGRRRHRLRQRSGRRVCRVPSQSAAS